MQTQHRRQVFNNRRMICHFNNHAMRFALRNQSKIADKLGDKSLQQCLQSLKATFINVTGDEINRNIHEVSGLPFPILKVNNVLDERYSIIFYVTGRMYDVLHLALKEFKQI